MYRQEILDILIHNAGKVVSGGFMAGSVMAGSLADMGKNVISGNGLERGSDPNLASVRNDAPIIQGGSGIDVVSFMQNGGKIVEPQTTPSDSATETPVAPIAPIPEGTISCTNCGATIAPGKKFCTKCGTPIDTPKKRFCTKCGTEAAADDMFCGSCGHRF